MATVSCWSVNNPPPGIDARVREICATERRSISNAVLTLVAEALDHRAREELLRVGHDAFVERLRKQLEPTAA
jgi:hypothetical protein